MHGNRPRALTRMLLLTMACSWNATAHAQLFPWLNPCQPCGPAPMAYAAPAPVAMAPAQTASLDCPCLKPVTETVYRDVEQVDYRTVEKTVKRPKVVTVMEDREVTTYQQVTEQRTANVPSYIDQTVTEMRPVTVNQSYWQTHHQPVQKCTPCQFDPRPGLVGELNRLGYAMRNTITPNYVTRREFVPNVVTTQVPVQRTVRVPTERQVTYNVARMVPVTTTQKVAVQKTVWEDETVTAYEPYVTRKRVAVGTRTRMAYVDPQGGSTTASAEPTPATTAESDGQEKSAEKNNGDGKGSVRQLSVPRKASPPVRFPGDPQQQTPPQPQPPQAQSAPSVDEQAHQLATTTPQGREVAQSTGWTSTRPEHAAQPVPATGDPQGPILSIARN